ncbi:hypothetical protein ACSAZK_14800 [Methanosarcina sp. Mfa9]|uniref:hypothetical protein n=1 Tax=Methanosarcina sp. Mfa9 TaxID=3439063 RepID=UPI003F875D1E
MTGEDAGENLPRVPCTFKQSFFLAEALFIPNVLASCFKYVPPPGSMVHLKSGKRQNEKEAWHQTLLIDCIPPAFIEWFSINAMIM